MSKQNNSESQLLCFSCQAPGHGWRTVNGHNIMKCTHCDMGWLSPMPDAALLKKYYDEYLSKYPQRSISHINFKQLESHYTTIDRRRLEHIAAALGRPMAGCRVLDIGCANGLFIKNAQRRGMQVEGVEISEAEAAEAREFTGAVIHEDILENLDLPAESFDVVTGWDVFEHVLDPKKFIDEIHRILKPGGVVALATINHASLNHQIFGTRWGFFIPPEHTVYYSRGSLQGWFERNGFISKRTRTYIAPQLTWQGIRLTLQKEQNVQGFNTPDSMFLLKIKKLVSSVIDAGLQYTRHGDVLEYYGAKSVK